MTTPSTGTGMRLDRLVDEINSGAIGGPVELRGDGSTEVDGLAYDSRKVHKGDLFCCVGGFETDGHRFAGDAAKAGAAALMVERWLDDPPSADLPQLRVGSTRSSMAAASAAFFAHPSRELNLAGVTGTNGKTSVTFMIEEIFARAGKVTGLTGTIETRFAGKVAEVSRTTPEAPDLQRLLREMVSAGVEVASMEVSSHALALERVTGTEFTVGVFTNLSQDHLDFHTSMEEYFLSKRRLFEGGMSRQGVLNADDPWCARVADEVTEIEFLTFSRSAEAGADLWSESVEVAPSGCSFVLNGAAGRHSVRMKLRAGFAVDNALAAAGAALVMGAEGDEIATGLESILAVPGRFEPVDAGQEFLAVVDYAHTPDAVRAVLESARMMAGEGRVIVVVGCGGDRDRTKRPLMARAAAGGADRAVLTSDNPRSEDPEAILDEMASGIDPIDSPRVERVADRRSAISHAVALARPGDVVVVAGKGHESGQTIGGVTYPFDDRVVLREALDQVNSGRDRG